MDDRHALHPPADLDAILRDTVRLGFGMASEPLTGALLRTLAASKPGGRLLELGTGTGLATAWLLDAMNAHAHLTSVDSESAVQAVARTHLGRDPRVRFVLQDGDTFIPEARAAGLRYDLIFADTWPGKYRLMEETLGLLAPGGLFLIDDMLPQPNWPEDHAPKAEALIAHLEDRQDLWFTKLSWASGLILIAVRPAQALH